MFTATVSLCFTCPSSNLLLQLIKALLQRRFAAGCFLLDSLLLADQSVSTNAEIKLFKLFKTVSTLWGAAFTGVG